MWGDEEMNVGGESSSFGEPTGRIPETGYVGSNAAAIDFPGTARVRGTHDRVISSTRFGGHVCACVCGGGGGAVHSLRPGHRALSSVFEETTKARFLGRNADRCVCVCVCVCV